MFRTLKTHGLWHMLHFGHVIEHYGAICHKVPPTHTIETKYVYNVHADMCVCVCFGLFGSMKGLKHVLFVCI
jgi:hypothetical protein